MLSLNKFFVIFIYYGTIFMPSMIDVVIFWRNMKRIDLSQGKNMRIVSMQTMALRLFNEYLRDI
jgi:hypothetical protein